MSEPRKPRKLFRLTRSQWMRLTQQQQLDLYNLCVDNLTALGDTIGKMGQKLREDWESGKDN